MTTPTGAVVLLSLPTIPKMGNLSSAMAVTYIAIAASEAVYHMNLVW